MATTTTRTVLTPKSVKPSKNPITPTPIEQTVSDKKPAVAALKKPNMVVTKKSIKTKVTPAVADKLQLVTTPKLATADNKRGRGRPTNADQGIAEPVYLERMRKRAKKRNMSLAAYMAERKTNRKTAAITKSGKKAAPVQKKKAAVSLETLPLFNPESVREVRIKHTNRLDKFTLHPANRKVMQGTVKTLIEEITKNNLLHLNPIIVDNDNRIINGQHRYIAAKTLGLTIYYIQGDVSAKEMLDLNANQKSLVLKDYLDSYTAQGFQEYIRVNEFLAKHKIVLYNAIGLLSGRNSQPNADLVNAFKNGEFKIKDLEHAERVLSIRDKMKDYAPEFYQQKNFTNAVAKVISSEGFDESRLDTRLKKNGHGQLRQAVTTDLYAEQILGVYNYGMPKTKHLVLD